MVPIAFVVTIIITTNIIFPLLFPSIPKVIHRSKYTFYQKCYCTGDRKAVLELVCLTQALSTIKAHIFQCFKCVQ